LLIDLEEDKGARPVVFGLLAEMEVARVAYDLGSTTLVTTQRCFPILRSRTNPSFS
jgi:hypothetical protein